MRRFFIPKEQIENMTAVIKGQDVNHIKNVLRMRLGEALCLCDGCGNDYEAVIIAFNGESIEVRIERVLRNTAEPKTKISLFQAVPKAEKMELIVQKAVELGIFEIIPVYTERCIVGRLDSKKEQKKLERWNMIAEAAAKQSGRGLLPRVQAFHDFNAAVAQKPKTRRWIFWELEAERSLRTVLSGAARGDAISIFIGPEGGLSESEIQNAKHSGWESISIGPRILRTETAGLAVVASIMCFLNEMEISH